MSQRAKHNIVRTTDSIADMPKFTGATVVKRCMLVANT